MQVVKRSNGVTGPILPLEVTAEAAEATSKAGGKRWQEAVWVGWALGIGASCLFSFAPTIARGVILSGMNSTTLLLWRLWLATIFFGITIFATNYRLFQVSRQTLLVTSFAGTMNGIGMMLFFWALELVDASISSMILSLIPLVVLSLLALRGERFTYRHIIRLGLGLGRAAMLIRMGFCC